MARRPIHVYALYGLLLVVTTGCSISRQQEIELGRQARPQFEQEFGGLHPDAELQRYVQQVGQELAEQTDRPDLPWEFRVLRSDQVNAFALPGGFIYVTEGMLRQLQNEAQLAAVLGHEVGHVAHRHSVRQLQRSQLVQGGGALASILGGSSEAVNLGQLVGGLALMKYGRDQEKQADLSGMEYLVEEGYEPKAMLGVMEVLEKTSGTAGDAPPEFLSSHPAPANRKQYLAEAIEGKFPGRISYGRTDAAEFRRYVAPATASATAAQPVPAAARQGQR